MQPTALLQLAFCLLAYSLASPSQPSMLNSKQRNLPSRDEINCLPCICNSGTALVLTKAELRQNKRSHLDEVSVSPFNPSTTSQQTSSTPNSNRTRDTSQQASQSWPPTTETVLTALFRAIVTVLSLLNVNFTWRIHGKETVIVDEHDESH